MKWEVRNTGFGAGKPSPMAICGGGRVVWLGLAHLGRYREAGNITVMDGFKDNAICGGKFKWS